MQHGGQKLFGWFGGMDGEGATAGLASQMGVAGMLEMFGGLLLLIGLLTRPLALVLVIEMAVAYAAVHAPQGLVPVLNQGELALLYGLVFLFFFGNGAGRLSVDSWLMRRERLVTDRPRTMEPAVPERAAETRRRGHAA